MLLGGKAIVRVLSNKQGCFFRRVIFLVHTRQGSNGPQNMVVRRSRLIVVIPRKRKSKGEQPRAEEGMSVNVKLGVEWSSQFHVHVKSRYQKGTRQCQASEECNAELVETETFQTGDF
jgi:hypothetical protein